MLIVLVGFLVDMVVGYFWPIGAWFSLVIWSVVSALVGFYHLAYCFGIGYDLHKKLGIPVFKVESSPPSSADETECDLGFKKN